MNDSNVIIINGKCRSGKDEFVNMVYKFTPHSVFNYSTITDIKTISIANFGVPIDAKTDKERIFWSKIKDAWTEYNDGPTQNCISTVREWIVCMNTPKTIFIHCREANEIRKIKNGLKKYADFIMTLLVERINFTKETACEKDTQDFKSELEYDLIIKNNNLNKLERDARNFVKTYLYQVENHEF